MKRRTVARILDAIDPGVSVRLYTRWRAQEVRAGVSDLEVLDVVEARENTELRLVDELHAKLYIADDNALVGSANLTATALGWATPSNLELLHQVQRSSSDVELCLKRMEESRVATQEEKARVREEADHLTAPELPMSEDLEEGERPGLWLPSMSAPGRLYEAYEPSARGRLNEQMLTTAQVELDVLSPPPGLSRETFNRFVAERLLEAPAMRILTDRIERDDLTDGEAMDLIEGLAVEGTLSTHRRWEVIREWLTTFHGDRIEIVPESFVTRRRPGVRQR